MRLLTAAGKCRAAGGCARPCENRIISVLTKDGALVSRATWKRRDYVAEQDAAARDFAAAVGSNDYPISAKGTIAQSNASDGAIDEQLCSWRVATTIDAIKDWVFRQSR